MLFDWVSAAQCVGVLEQMKGKESYPTSSKNARSLKYFCGEGGVWKALPR